MRIDREGYSTIAAVNSAVAAVMAVTAVVLFPRYPVWGWTAEAALLILAVLVVAFFREPSRPHVTCEGTVYAPADGKIVVIEDVMENECFSDRRIQVSIFMSIFNVHINWFPVSGRVIHRKYFPGRYLVASHPKSSDDNEHLSVGIDTGREIVAFRQIAGLIARRIVNYAQTGDTVSQNEKCGFIKFGSRVDVFLPMDAEITVEIGQKVTGSITPIARLKR